MEKLTGKVAKIILRKENSNYSIFLMNANDQENLITVVGTYPILFNGMNLDVFGNWKKHPKFGRQLVTESYEVLLPKYKYDIFPFLTSSYIGCDYFLSKEIENKIGLNYFEIYKDVSKVKSFLNIKDDKTNASITSTLYDLKNNINNFLEIKESVLFLVKNGLDQLIANKIVFSETFTNLNEIKEFPYSIMKLYGVDWKQTDNFAINLGFSRTGLHRYLEALKYLLDLACEEHAHMFLPFDSIKEAFIKFVNFKDDFEIVLNKGVEEKSIYVDGLNRVYLMENFICESLFAKSINRVNVSKRKIEINSSTLDFTDFTYSDSQKDAIKMTVENNVSIICGSAGTGKSTILKKVFDIHKKAGYEISLVGPTGRAAKRLSEVTGAKAKTMHLALAYDGNTNRPSFNENVKMFENCYIIDEFSMVDIKLAMQFFSAIPDGSKIIIVGDPNQLPSVGPGTVLKDLLTKDFFPVFKLEKIFRQKSGELSESVEKIKDGLLLSEGDYPKKTDFKIFNVDDVNRTKEYLKVLVEKFMQNKNHNILEDLQIITPTNIGQLGTIEINKFLQDIINPVKLQKNILKVGYLEFRLGDKVISNSNDYDKKIYNGDTGIIKFVDVKNKSIMVEFYGKSIPFSDDELFNLSLAYCSTVHKAQGGEYKFVIMLLNKAHGKMLNRKVLYTGASRAKKGFIGLTTFDILNSTIKNNGEKIRYSTLVDRLKQEKIKSLLGLKHRS